MIKLTMYNDSDVIVNADLIESVEHTPDTLISLSTGKKVMVKESVEDVVGKVITYRRLVAKNNKVLGRTARFNVRKNTRGCDKWTQPLS